MRRIVNDMTEELDYVPTSFRVVRPKLGCRILRPDRPGAVALYCQSSAASPGRIPPAFPNIPPNEVPIFATSIVPSAMSS